MGGILSLCNGIKIFKIGLRYSCICQGTSTKRQRRAFLVVKSNYHLFYQSIHSYVEAIPLSALPKDTTNELAGLPSHYPSFMLNVMQGSRKYQLLKSFGLTRPENRTQVYRLLAQK